MSKIFEIIGKEIKLNDTEAIICDYINENLDEIPSLSSRELAKRTYSSSTSVIRFAKKLGFNNYNEFKLNIVSYLKNVHLDNVDITGNEDYLMMINKLTEIEVGVIQQTKEMISVNTLKNVSELLMKATYIDIIAEDANSQIARYACHNFYIIGKIATVYSENDSKLYLSMLASKDHVVMVITKYERSKYIDNALDTLKKRGITTIAFIAQNNHRIEKKCDYFFRCAFNDSIQKLGDLVFNISTKYLLDLLFAIMFSQKYEDTLKLERIHRIIFNK